MGFVLVVRLIASFKFHLVIAKRGDRVRVSDVSGTGIAR